MGWSGGRSSMDPLANPTEDGEAKIRTVYNSITAKADKLKEKGNTITIRPGYVGLCFTCQHAFIYRAQRKNDPVIVCNEDYRGEGRDVKPLDIIECNRYAKHGELDLWDLVRSTKIVDLGVETKRMGFDPSKEPDAKP